MAYEEKSGSRFIVDLGDIKLPRLVEKQVEAQIQAAVLRGLAESDFGGNKQTLQKSLLWNEKSSIWDQFPGQTLGLWIGRSDEPPFIFGSGGFDPPLTVKDHTLIMKAIMENSLGVLKYIPDKYKLKNGRPLGKEVLQAVLQVEQIDDYVKSRIRKILDLVPKFEEAQRVVLESHKDALDGLRQQLTKKTIQEQHSMFRDAGLRRTYSEIAEGMEIAAQMLEDGQDSIYSPDFSFYKTAQDTITARDALSDIGSMDTIGATVGGATGSLGGGIGAGPGAVAGGTLASAGEAVVSLIRWIW